MHAAGPGPAGDATFDRFLQDLNETLYAHWNLGRNALVGWSRNGDGIQVICVPALRVFRAHHLHPRIFYGGRMLGAGTFEQVANILEAEPLRIPLPVGMNETAVIKHKADINALFAPYTVSKTRQRAVFLVDVAGFSLFSAEEQAAQLSVLEYSFNVAKEKAHQKGIEVDLARSTTGDGFYVWNREKSLDSDINLFCVLMIALAHQALQHRVIASSYTPTIRTCFGVGSHYSYYQLNWPGPIEGDFIVGDVTIHLARLIEHARPNQILIGDFNRTEEETTGEIGTEEFVESAGRVLQELDEIKMGGRGISRLTAYLTGPRTGDGSFVNRRLTVLDKHGISHAAYNAKVNIFLKDDPPIYLGLPDSEIRPGVAA